MNGKIKEGEWPRVGPASPPAGGEEGGGRVLPMKGKGITAGERGKQL